MKQLKFIVILGLSLFLTIQISAQYTGPGSHGTLFTIEQIKADASKLDKSDALVQVRGYIIEQVGKEEYWFRDSTGKILIEIEDKDLPREPFNEKTPVIITGEVDYDLLEGVEIEVEELRFINP